MSKSTRKAFIKQGRRNSKKSTMYNRKVRRVQNQFVRNNDEIDSLPSPRVIYNDYDYSDWIWDYENILTGEEYKQELIKNRRK